MKKSNLLAFTILTVGVLIFSSCEKEGLQPPENNSDPALIAPSTNYIVNSHQSIIFQVSTLNEHNEMEYGWVITNEGDIQKYQLEKSQNWSPEDPSKTFHELKTLKQSAGEKIEKLDRLDLYDKFRKINSAANYKVNDLSTTKKSRIAYVAYKISDESKEDCGNDCDSDYDTYVYDQVLLTIESESNESELGPVSSEILAWLKDLEVKLNLLD